MGKSLVVKLLWIGLLWLLLLIPLSMLDGLVSERQARGREVATEIAGAVGGEQTVIGPLLLLDLVRPESRQRTVNDGGFLQQVDEVHDARRQWLLPPQRWQADVDLHSERRGRGPFESVLFHTEQGLVADFRLPDDLGLQPGERIERARIVLALGDPRGIREVGIEVDGDERPVEPGSGLAGRGTGVSAVLGELPAAGAELHVVVSMALSGSERLGWVPVGDANTLKANGDWPHPGFTGNRLPETRDIDASGFRAEWRISHLASDAQRQLQACVAEAGQCPALDDQAVALRLVDPVDRYLMTERAIKYSLLFVALIFGAVFFIEVLKTVPVHPMQYALVGLALAIFYLLLLALSEHVGLGLAYLLAASACTALIGSYLAAALGRRRALVLAALLSVLYALLYSLLVSEDMALLVGAIALFGLLATVMIATRRIDWRRVGS